MWRLSHTGQIVAYQIARRLAQGLGGDDKRAHRGMGFAGQPGRTAWAWLLRPAKGVDGKHHLPALDARFRCVHDVAFAAFGAQAHKRGLLVDVCAGQPSGTGNAPACS